MQRDITPTEAMIDSVKRRTQRWATKVAQRAGLDRNPLRRGYDKAEALIRLGLVVLFLAGSPLAAIAMGHWASSSAYRTARAQAASERQVHAVLQRNAPRADGYPTYGQADLAWVPARWTAPDGASRSGDIPAPLGRRKGSAVSVWTDSSGQLAYPPIGQAQIASRIITIVALTPAFLALILMGLFWLVKQVLDRRRMASWEAGWSAVGPHWTKRLH